MTAGQQRQRTIRRARSLAAVVGTAAAALGCAGELPTSANRTTLYIYAPYASPNVTVAVNGQSLGTITQEYTGSLDCTVLPTKGSADGVFSVSVAGDQHYDVTWKYSNGTSGDDAFDATPEFFQSPCLLEDIPAPASGDRGESSILARRSGDRLALHAKR